MDQFRLILVLIGVVILVLVYFISRRSGHFTKLSSAPESEAEVKPDTVTRSLTRRKIPMSGDVAPPERPYQAVLETKKPERRRRLIKFVQSATSGLQAKENLYQSVASVAPLSVVVYVLPTPGVQFRRELVMHSLQSLGCIPRNDEGFDYLILDDNSGKRVNRLFTIHDVHDKGIFSHSIDAPQATNGLVFEMKLPGPIESVMAFEKLLDIASLIATKLNGVVCDDLQNRLTKQATTHIKDKIIDYNRKLRYGQSPSLQ